MREIEFRAFSDKSGMWPWKKLQNQLIDKVFDERDSLRTENARLLLLLADIRSALGDPEGKMMQEDFVKHCKEVVEWLNKLDFADWKGGAIKNRGEYGFALYDLGGCIVEHYKTPLEALTAYLKGKE